MTAERDMTRIVRSWLRTDEHESADRVLDDVLARLDATPQRRPWWPARRIADMNTYAKILIAAAAVVVVAVVGLNMLPARGGVGGGGPSPTPSATPTARSTASPSPAAVFPPSGALAADTKLAMTLERVPLTLSVPTSDWVSNGEWGIDKGAGMGPEGAGFIFWVDDTPVGVYTDPCTQKEGPPLGASPAALAAAVAAVPGTDLVSGPSDVTVGGHPAKHVVITIREDIACAPEAFYLWYSPTEGIARYASQPGSTIGVWIIDVDGTTVWIDGETYKGAGPKPAQEVQQVIDSIRFD